MKVTGAISPGSATSYSDSIKTELITLESVVYVKYSALPLSCNESAEMWVQKVNDLNPVGQLWKMIWFPCPPSLFIFPDHCQWMENTSSMDVFSLNNEEQAAGLAQCEPSQKKKISAGFPSEVQSELVSVVSSAYLPLLRLSDDSYSCLLTAPMLCGLTFPISVYCSNPLS